MLSGVFSSADKSTQILHFPVCFGNDSGISVYFRGFSIESPEILHPPAKFLQIISFIPLTSQGGCNKIETVKTYDTFCDKWYHRCVTRCSRFTLLPIRLPVQVTSLSRSQAVGCGGG